MGFGAERANLMQAEHVYMPAQTQASTPQTQTQSTSHYEAPISTDSQFSKAKNQFLEEISKISSQSSGNMVITENEFTAEQMHFAVTNPVKVGSVVKYSVTGQDSEGRFETQRRFNEFFTLRKVLNERWPGCYIPCIPEKKAVNVDLSKSNPMEWKLAGNQDGKFIEERRALLERFLRELAKYDFIIESKEFRIFSRGVGEIDEALTKLPKQSALAILEKYRLNFKIDEDQDQQEMQRYREKINVFGTFIRKALG